MNSQLVTFILQGRNDQGNWAEKWAPSDPVSASRLAKNSVGDATKVAA